jgi:DNA-binding NtrC family response regulator
MKQKEISKVLDQPFRILSGSLQKCRKYSPQFKKLQKPMPMCLILGENGTGKELVARALIQEFSKKG